MSSILAALSVPMLGAVVFSAGCGGARASPPPVAPAGGEPSATAVTGGAGPPALSLVAHREDAPPDVEDALRRQGDRLRPCWDRLALDHPEVSSGRAIVRFELDPSGRVRSADLLSAPVEDPAFRTCVEGRVREMRFPQGDASSVFRHAFEFGVGARTGVE